MSCAGKSKKHRKANHDDFITGDDTLVRQNTDKLPGNVLTINLKKIWEVIKDQKDLNLPAHKVCLAHAK